MRRDAQFSEYGAGRPMWLVTFADLVALLIAFFVMLFATQKVDAEKWEALVDTFSRRLNPDQVVIISRPSADRNADRFSPDRAIDLDYLDAVLRDKMRIEPQLAGLEVRRQEDNLVLALPADLLFAPGKADIGTRGRPALFILAGVLETIGNRIDIVGHADPTPLPVVSHFLSNWQLSIARAVAVANELRRAGYHRNLVASGFGASQFGMLPSAQAGAQAGAQRLAAARRVDVVIWPTAGLR